MYPTSSEGLNKETDSAVYFFTPAFHVFDNFSAHQVEIWGKKFPTAEHAFQWKKFSQARLDIAEQIFNAPSPELANQRAHAHRQDYPKDWSEVKVNIMREILTAKLEQNIDVKEQLRKSGQREIVENNPVDSFWGCGADGKGENIMGKLWMEIRNNLSIN